MKRLGMAFAKGNLAFQNYFKISERLNKHGDKDAVVVKKKKKSTLAFQKTFNKVTYQKVTRKLSSHSMRKSPYKNEQKHITQSINLWLAHTLNTMRKGGR